MKIHAFCEKNVNTTDRGDFEEKLNNIIRIVQKYEDKVILFIDEMHLIVGAGSSEANSMDAANILKPFISRGEIHIIGATTNDEWHTTIEKDKAFMRRFHKILINPPTKGETLEILHGVKDDYDKHFGRSASEDLLKEIVELSDKYSIDLSNPAKSIDMMDLAYAHAKIFNSEGQFVMGDDIREAIRLKYDIEAVEDRVNVTSKELNSFILGQDDVMKKIETQLKYADLKLTDLDKPIFSVIFAGPTGVGKTETAKIIARKFFGNDRCLIKLNMGEYGSEFDVSKLIGSPNGYVGFTEETDLIKSVKQNPNSVVLFDEIEKAHPKVFDTLLSILDTGVMKSNNGEQISFKNTIIIFTTNLGYEAGFSKAQGLGFAKSKTTNEDILENVKKHFRPEFINRLDDIIVFNGLTNEIADTLIDRYVKDFENTSGMKFTLTEDDYKEIREEADIEEYGARGLKRAVRKQLLKIQERSVVEEKESESV